MPEVHAILSASSSKRWLNCTPSARLEQNFPNESSVYAEEGTAAHALGEYKLRKYLHERVQRPTSEYENEEMEANTDIYAEFIISTVERIKETCPHPLVMVEERLDYSYLVPSGFGTGDCVIIADGTLYVMDYKNGKGVFVNCDHNPQMMLYALGALEMFSILYDINEIQMVIFQPRIENISEFSMPVSDLLDWAENELKPKAELAAKGEGEFCAGEHCRFCKVKATCRKRAEYNLTLAQYDFSPAATLEDREIEAILEKADALTAWAADVKEYALSQALAGKQWTGYKVVEGRSNRKYTDEKAVAEAVKAIGENPYCKPEVLGITAMTKLLGGKKKFDELLSKYVCKPQGKPTLVPASDKRKAWNPAQNEFKGEF